MTESMIERVARAINPWQLRKAIESMALTPESDVMAVILRTMARASIEAMREPTEVMLRLGQWSVETCTKDDPCNMAAKHIWLDMIDAALAEGC